jgi:hypothetical protein
VPVAEFVFSVRLSRREQSTRLLGDVAANVFRHLGSAASTADDVVGQLTAVVSSRLNGDVEFDVRFHGHAGSCDIVVCTGGREIWRITRHLP